jgi:hypothetical protein
VRALDDEEQHPQDEKLLEKVFHSFPDRNGKESKIICYTMESSIKTLLNIDALNKLAASAETPESSTSSPLRPFRL